MAATAHAVEAYMEETDRVLEAWAATAAQLPDGWAIDSLRCASTSLREPDRSDDWIARAVGPDGQHREFQASDPVDALLGLTKQIGAQPGQIPA